MMLELTPNPAWLRGAEYDSVRRRHVLDGRPVPSVTEAIGFLHPDRFARVPAPVLARKAAIGTAVHAAAHYHAEGDLNESSLAQEVQSRFAAWTWFRATREVVPVLCETVVCARDLGLPPSRRRPYIGKLDFLCVVNRRLVVLIDLKTGDPSLAGPQTLAYLDALYQQYPQLIAVDVQRWAVVVQDTGRYVIHPCRDDRADAAAFRAALEAAYRREPFMSSMSFDLPPDDDQPAFDLPDDDAPPASILDLRTSNDIPPRVVQAARDADVLPADGSLALLPIRELDISPDVDAYLSALERAIAPYEAQAKAFADEMARVPVDTPDQIAWIGQQALVAKQKEQALESLFDSAIRKPRLYLDRVYAVRRRVLEWLKTGGATAATRHSARRRELEEADRRAKADADRRAREAQLDADRQAAAERQRLTEAALMAAQQGNPTAAATLIDQAREVEVVPVPVDPAPAAMAPAAAVAGLSDREGWAGDITDMKLAILAAARPDILREVADLIEGGDLTPAGAASLTTRIITEKLRALAQELPIIPSTMFAPHAAELKKRATADRDTLTWPGFTFTQTFTPVRRTRTRT